jgi:hypothetical protein
MVLVSYKAIGLVGRDAIPLAGGVGAREADARPSLPTGHAPWVGVVARPVRVSLCVQPGGKALCSCRAAGWWNAPGRGSRRVPPQPAVAEPYDVIACRTEPVDRVIG